MKFSSISEFVVCVFGLVIGATQVPTAPSRRGPPPPPRAGTTPTSRNRSHRPESCARSEAPFHAYGTLALGVPGIVPL
eukprot:6196968-Pleurochrysis_carterae.AAC.6